MHRPGDPATAPLPSAVLEALRSFESPLVSNAVEAFGVRDRSEGYASRELRCHTPDLPPLVGFAVTCTANSTNPGAPRVNRLNDLLDAVAAAPSPAVVVVQHVGPDRERSCMIGDVISTVFRRLGAVGVVTDAGIRDLSGIRERAPGFHVFSPGAVVSHGNAAVLDVNVPVSVCGLAIKPGDLLHGDESGLLTVPHQVAGAVVDRARHVRQEETAIFRFLEEDSLSLAEIKRRLGH
jgi:regulator of RNase E activity RraA